MHPSQRLRAIAAVALCLIIVGLIHWMDGEPTLGRPDSIARESVQTPTSTAPTENPESSSAHAAQSAEESVQIAAAPTPSAVPLPIPVANHPDENPIQSTREQAANGRSIPDILEGADMSDPEIRASVVAQIRLLEERQTEAVLEKARRLGIPVRIEGPGNKVSILHDFRGDEPLYRNTLNRDAAISTGANLVNSAPYSLDGGGIKVGVWDGGSVRDSHQELSGRVTKRNNNAAIDDHATHVAGTIGAKGIQANAKGMAPLATIDSYDWNSDYAEMSAAGAASAGDTTRIPLSNHSYGYGASTADMGRYENEARTTDATAAALPYYLVFWAAGNEQDELTAKGGYQSITFNGLAKNVVTVGAVNDAVSNGVRSPGNGTISYFSSLGPCDDGRIKPDLVANGVSVRSPIASSNQSYSIYNGTSMATPNATGSAALLVQLYAREFSGQRMRASTLKALLIHTADDLGTPGPDYTYGWGLINVKAAADLILEHKNSLDAPKIIEGQLTNANKIRTHNFTWNGVSPIRATLNWTDPAGTSQTNADSRTPNLRHNLDAKITAPDGLTTYQPFVMPFVGNWSTAAMASAAIRGKNNVDTVEQVYLAAPTQAGTYTVTVSLDGNLNPNNQSYSLIITGGSNIDSNPPPDVALVSPLDGTAVLPGASVTLAATATDLTIGGAAGSVSKVEFLNGTTVLGEVATPPYTLDWTPPMSGSFSITARATDSEGASATSAAAFVHVLTGDGVPVISSFTPNSGAAGSLVVLTGFNFVNVSAVKFDGVTAAHIVDSAGQITATVPTGATTGVLSVTTGYGTGTSESIYTIIAPPVLISQVYGASSNTGASVRRDYIELHNRGQFPVSLSGWSVQYASATGTTWQSTNLSGTIAPGSYYLIGQAAGSSGATLPTPEASGTINMSATSGKIALLNSTTLLTGSSPLGSEEIQDFVGYGSANAFEGPAAAPSPSTTTAIFRAGSGAIDTDMNSADFTTSSPNPRNSVAGSVSAPVVTSASTATGTVNSPFFYQISAANSPVSYNATGLPGGLSINTSTGLINGTPTAVGVSPITIAASNPAGTGSATLILTINPPSGGGEVNLFSENMGTASGTRSIADNVFQNSAITFTGTADVRSTSPSNLYAGASGGRNVFVADLVGREFVISGINTLNYSGLTLSFGHWKSANGGSNELVVETSTDGSAYSPLAYSRPVGTGASTWMKITPTGAVPSTPNLRIRFRQTTTTSQFRVDDVVLSGVPAVVSTPELAASGSLVALSTTYGSASSTSTSFTIAGVDLTEGVTVTPPAGFEASLTESSGYGAGLVIPASDTLATTPVFLRLASNVMAGSYSGNVTCTSAGAVVVSVPTAISTVRQKLLTVSANPQIKSFGAPLNLGTGQTGFTSSGLVGSETIGSVTLAANGGTGANDPAGTYTIAPSDATGGTFQPSNYDFNYLPATLTITAPSFDEWIGFYPVDLLEFDDDPDNDGIPNGVENLLGTAPDAPSPGLTQVSTTADTLTFRHTRANSPAIGLTARYEWSADFQNWHSSATSAEGVTVVIVDSVIADNPAPENDLIEVTATVTQGSPGKLFVRLVASKP